MSKKTIREVTAMTGATERALRYYDEKGLVSPTYKNPTGRREWLYDAEAIKKIKRIMVYRRAGFLVEHIKVLLTGTKDDVRKIIEGELNNQRTQRQELDRRIAMAELLQMINNMEADLSDRILEDVFNNEEEAKG